MPPGPTAPPPGRIAARSARRPRPARRSPAASSGGDASSRWSDADSSSALRTTVSTRPAGWRCPPRSAHRARRRSASRRRRSPAAPVRASRLGTHGCGRSPMRRSQPRARRGSRSPRSSPTASRCPSPPSSVATVAVAVCVWLDVVVGGDVVVVVVVVDVRVTDGSELGSELAHHRPPLPPQPASTAAAATSASTEVIRPVGRRPPIRRSVGSRTAAGVVRNG